MAGAGRQPTLAAAPATSTSIKPLNLNTRVNEADQVDTLNVFNGDSPADDTGVLTADSLAASAWAPASTLAGPHVRRRHHATATSRR